LKEKVYFNNILSFAAHVAKSSHVLIESVPMLGRRQYRIKILQSLYAYFQGGEPRLDIAEKNLFHSIDKTYELFYLQLSFLLELLDFYHTRSEDAKRKFLPTEDEKNPNMRLLDNAVVIQLQQNEDLRKKIDKYKFNWADEQEMLRRTYQKFRDSKDHREYLKSAGKTFDSDREFVGRMFRKFIARSPELQFYCEDRSIYWADDFEWAASFVLKALKSIPEDFPVTGTLASLLQKEEEDDPSDDRKFTADLFRKTIIHSDEFAGLIGERTRNWELERIALTDIILLKMALSELMFFQNIPVKVTMNEYIEISKHFSSAKSKLFINGILDKLVSDLKGEEKITKTGRGLVEK
jgi:N utilization substance protein B